MCGDSLGGSGVAAASAQPAFSWTCGREGRSADVTFALVTSGIASSTETPYGPGPRGPWMGLSRSWLRGTQRHSMSQEGWGSLVTLSTAEPSCAGSSWWLWSPAKPGFQPGSPSLETRGSVCPEITARLARRASLGRVPGPRCGRPGPGPGFPRPGTGPGPRVHGPSHSSGFWAPMVGSSARARRTPCEQGRRRQWPEPTSQLARPCTPPSGTRREWPCPPRPVYPNSPRPLAGNAEPRRSSVRSERWSGVNLCVPSDTDTERR